jgi:DNA-directed RNA polymerase subunit RPC12/RpoP
MTEIPGGRKWQPWHLLATQQGLVMVNKLCAICGRYFEGELNGNYACPDCQDRQIFARRPLVSLDSLGQPVAVAAKDAA